MASTPAEAHAGWRGIVTRAGAGGGAEVGDVGTGVGVDEEEASEEDEEEESSEAEGGGEERSLLAEERRPSICETPLRPSKAMAGTAMHSRATIVMEKLPISRQRCSGVTPEGHTRGGP